MKWYYSVGGGHTHVRVFMNGGKCGDLCFRNEEFALVRECCPWITFLEEGEAVKNELATVRAARDTAVECEQVSRAEANRQRSRAEALEAKCVELEAQAAKMRAAIQLFVGWCKTPDRAPTPELIEAQHEAIGLQ